MVAVLASWLVLPATAAPSDRAQVHAAFRGFLRALAQRDADTGAALLSAASLVEWQSNRRLALHADRDEVAAQPPGRRLVVFALRHYEPSFLAKDGSPHDLVEHGIRAGLADEESLSRIELADVVVRGDRASGNLLAAGLPSTFRADFVREAGAWKLDLPGTLRAAGRVVSQAAIASDSSEDAILAGLLTLASGERPTARIWQPLARADAPAVSESAP